MIFEDAKKHATKLQEIKFSTVIRKSNDVNDLFRKSNDVNDLFNNPTHVSTLNIDTLISLADAYGENPEQFQNGKAELQEYINQSWIQGEEFEDHHTVMSKVFSANTTDREK